MYKDLRIYLVCIMLVLSMIFISTNMPIVSAEPTSTNVDIINPYWQEDVPEINIRATDNIGNADNITLYYRHSIDNSNWDAHNWTLWVGVNNPRQNSPWVWTFDCPYEDGYYEFYSIGENKGQYEDAPGSPDASCHVNYSSWTRFGYNYPGEDFDASLDDWIRGSNFTCPSDGMADSITWWVEITDYGHYRTKCAIYNNTGTKIGQTEEKNLSHYSDWVVFNFTGSKPFLTEGTDYILVAWSEGGYAHYDTYTASNLIEVYLNYTDSFPVSLPINPPILPNRIIPDFVYSIFCRYTESGSNSIPINSNSNPSNGDTGVALSLDNRYNHFNITINDADDTVQNLNITWRTNASGVWTTIGTNTNVNSGTYYCSVVSWVNQFNHKYWWSVNTSDGCGGWDNDTYYFTTYSNSNNPPNNPSNPNPANHATTIDINSDLSWVGGDPDFDSTVTYDIYFGTTSNPPLKKSDYTNTIYDPGVMNYNTKYYWKIIAKDNHGAFTSGPIWDFTTTSPPNNPPHTPGNPNPEKGEINTETNIVLIWSGGDPDIGDKVTYDVYFGIKRPLQKVASNISTQTYNPGPLANSITYFWSIVAWDNHGLSANSSEWYFTTKKANNPPNKPLINGKINGKPDTENEYKFVSTDPDEDNIIYCINWGDDTTEVWIGPYSSGVQVTAKHIWSEKGEYTIKAKARDVYGAESDWATFEVSMAKTRIYNPIMQLLLRILERFPLLEKMIQRFPFFEKILNLY